MIRNLTIANWKSFLEPTHFTMVATAEQARGETLSRVRRSRILPVSAFYGGNAAGKSAFISALKALQTTVCEYRDSGELLEMKPNLAKGRNKPCSFELEFVVCEFDETGKPHDQVFVYELEADRNRIHKEVLVRVRSKDEEILFERVGNHVEFYGAIAKESLVQAVALLLEDTESVLGRLGRLKAGPALIRSVYGWFQRSLVVVRPSARYRFLPDRLLRDEEFGDSLSRAISRADTGISRICFEEVNLERLPYTDEEIDEFLKKLRAEGEDNILLLGGRKNYYTLELGSDEEIPIVKVLVARHDEASEEDKHFSLPVGEESDGTLRYLDLLPLVMTLTDPTGTGVCVVDELERSLHPLLTESILQTFLESIDGNSRRQLIFTTHEATLLKSGSLRRDEVWLIDKDNGESSLERLSTYRDEGVRSGSAVLDMYLARQLGGTPRF